MNIGFHKLPDWRAFAQWAAVVAATTVWFATSVHPRVCAQALSEEELRTRIEQLRSDSVDVRAQAADALGRGAYRQREQVAPALRELIRNDPDWHVRASAGRAIGRLATRDAVPDLIRALRDPVVDVRVVAAAAIWRLPDSAAVPALIELLRDEDANARQWAALALGVIRDARAVPPLLAAMNDREKAVRLDVVRSLGRIRHESAKDALVIAARDERRESDERSESISALASLDGPAKLDALVQLLDLGDRDLRMHVISALGAVGDAMVIPTLRRRRSSEGPAGRTAIDEAIRDIGERARAQVAGEPTRP